MFNKLKDLFFGKKEENIYKETEFQQQQDSKQIQTTNESVIKRAKKYRKEASYR